MTVRLAKLLVALPKLFEKNARNCLPLSALAVVREYVPDVAPAILFQLVPLSVLTCHCREGVGLPLAAAVKVTVAPETTVELTGCVVTAGAAAVEIERLAELVVNVPMELVISALNLEPSSLVAACAIEYVAEVAPEIFAQFELSYLLSSINKPFTTTLLPPAFVILN